MKQSVFSAMCMAALLIACDRGQEPSTQPPPGLLEQTIHVAKQTAARVRLAVSEAAWESTSAVDAAKNMTDQTAERAATLVEQVRDGLAEDKPDMVKAAMEPLRAMQDSLSEGLQLEIARLEAMLADEPRPHIQPATPITKP
jgi:hypothetical protein